MSLIVCLRTDDYEEQISLAAALKSLEVLKKR
jgi:hypothetical protein